MVSAQAIIADIVPPRERGRYMGLIGSVFAVASVIGPLLGGFLVDQASWRWVFYVNMPVGALAIAIVVFRLHLHQPHTRHRIDYARRRAADRRRRRADPAHQLGRHRVRVGLVDDRRARRRERRAARRLRRAGAPRGRADRSRSSSSARASSRSRARWAATIGMAMFGAIVFIPVYLQLVYGASATGSGLRMIPLMAGLLVASIASGRAISRIGRYRPFPIAGTATLVVGMFLLSRLGVDTAPLAGVGLHAGRRRRHRARDAGARPGRPERRRSAQHRRRHVDRHVLPLRGRLARRRALRHDLRHAAVGPARPPAARGRRPAWAAASTSARRRPARSPPRCTTSSSTAFAHALHGVFLFGTALAIVPFALSWLLKEVPLRTTLHRSPELSAEQAAAGGATAEELVESRR